jgi:hypothetical protein
MDTVCSTEPRSGGSIEELLNENEFLLIRIKVYKKQ